MKKQIDYKKIYDDIKNDKLNKYYILFMKNKSEYNTRKYILGCFCKHILNQNIISEDELIKSLESLNEITNIRVE